LGKVFDMTKLSNRKPLFTSSKTKWLVHFAYLYGNTNLFVSSCFLCTSVPSSLALSLSRWLFTPSFVSRSSFLPCSSYALASFACTSFVFLFLSRLFCLFPDLLSFLTSLSPDLPPSLVFPYLPFSSFRVSYFAKFLELVLSFGFSQIDSQVRF
jgi:hypothetical protein